jgi:hypothetical protein
MTVLAPGSGKFGDATMNSKKLVYDEKVPLEGETSGGDARRCVQ